MKPKISFLLNIVLAVLSASVILLLAENEAVRRLELASLDLTFRLRGGIPYSPHIVLVEITDSDIAKIGRWPWKRAWHAAMAKALKELGAKTTYFDIVFSEASSEDDDVVFEEAIKFSKNVYLPFAFQGFPYDIDNALFPLKRFSSNVKGLGGANIYADADGAMRRVPLVFLTKDNLYPHAVLKVAMDYEGAGIKSLAGDRLILSRDGRDIGVPLGANNQMLINWPGRWQRTFKHYSFLDVLACYKAVLENKKPLVNPEDFKDSLCIVGITAIGLYDIKPVPLEPEYPGIGVAASAINNILNRDFIYTPPAWLDALIIYILALIPPFLIFGEKPLKEVFYVGLVVAAYFGMNFLLFTRGVRLELFTPLFGLVTSYFAIGTFNFVRISVERQRFFKLSVTDGLTGLYNIRYFKMLLETEIMLAKPDPSKKFTIVMSDVDHFKHFNDTYGHQVGDLVLKSVAGVLKGSVRTLDVVARYGGEEMIVLLRGTPLSNALSTADKIRKNVETNQVKDEKNTYNVTISLGISSYAPGDDVDSMIKRADDGLYKAKEAGRNKVCSVEECAP